MYLWFKMVDLNQTSVTMVHLHTIDDGSMLVLAEIGGSNQRYATVVKMKMTSWFDKNDVSLVQTHQFEPKKGHISSLLYH